jgi:hypothetical protein
MTLGVLDGALAGPGSTNTISVVVVVINIDLILVIVLVLIIDGDGVLDAVGQAVPVHCLDNVFIVGNRSEKFLVNGLARVGLLYHTKNTVIQVLVELLRIRESDRASRTGASHVLLGGTISFTPGWRLLTAIGRILFYAVNRGEVSLEDVGAVKRLLSCRTGARTEPAHHGTLVMGESVPILIVFSCEPFEMVFAGCDWALLRPFILVGEHVGFEILEDASTFWQRAETLRSAFLVNVVATTTLAAHM